MASRYSVTCFHGNEYPIIKHNLKIHISRNNEDICLKFLDIKITRLCSRNMEMPRACNVCMPYIFHTYVYSELEQCICKCMPTKNQIV